MHPKLSMLHSSSIYEGGTNRGTRTGSPQRSTGPGPQVPIPLIPPDSYQVTTTGALVQMNPYWSAARRHAPSAIVRRPFKGKSVPNPDLGCDVVQAMTAQKNVKPTQHYPVSGTFASAGIAAKGACGIVPVLAGGEVRFSANPVSKLNQLQVAGQSDTTTSAQLPPFQGQMVLITNAHETLMPPKRKNWWDARNTDSE